MTLFLLRWILKMLGGVDNKGMFVDIDLVKQKTFIKKKLVVDQALPEGGLREDSWSDGKQL